MRVHVTGGSGFLGRRVIPLLVSRDHTVTALARGSNARDQVERLGATALYGDLDDPASIDAAFADARGHVLANLASLGFGHAATLVSAAEEAGMTRAVFVSTTALFTHLEARSKAVREAAEDTIRTSSLEWTILRPTMIYGGPDDRNMARLVRLLRRTPVVPVPGGGRRLQQPVHVDDVASAVVAALETRDGVGRAYELAGPDAIPLTQVISETAGAVGRRPKLLPVPLGAARAIVRLYEGMSRRPRLRAEQLDRLSEDKVFDVSAARRDLGFNPRTFRDGIRHEAELIGAERD